MVRRIKNASEITDAKKSYIMEFPEEQKPKEKIKHNKKRYFRKFQQKKREAK